MKRLLLGLALLAITLSLPIPAMARVDVKVGIGIGLPPPIAFGGPPQVVVLPDTNVYVVPDIDVDLFFWNGWWWRLWDGHWYRSHYHNRGWGYYRGVPNFYYDVDPGWRGYYRDRRWYGHRWDYRPIPYGQAQRNWRDWEKRRYWEREHSWGVENFHPRSQDERRDLRRQREEYYHQRPDVHRSEPPQTGRGPERIQPSAHPPQDRLEQHMGPGLKPQTGQPYREPHGRVEQPGRPQPPQQMERQYHQTPEIPQQGRQGQGHQEIQPQDRHPEGRPEGGGKEHGR
jgi:hypothetical protein